MAYLDLETWHLIGPEWSGDLHAGLWFVQGGLVTWILASDWLRVICSIFRPCRITKWRGLRLRPRSVEILTTRIWSFYWRFLFNSEYFSSCMTPGLDWCINRCQIRKSPFKKNKMLLLFLITGLLFYIVVWLTWLHDLTNCQTDEVFYRNRWLVKTDTRDSWFLDDSRVRA